jgi:DtxR family transcriptional regulator, Mn-dependent transcriptional regulator
MTLTEENYLKALFHLSLENKEVSVLDLSKSLSIKMPTVNSMVKKLAAKNLVQYEKYKPLSLTNDGKTEAGLIIRKHRLVEMFLVEKLGFGWDEVHEIAEQIEHINAPKFFKKIDELLNFPKVDPHGSPIPDASGNVAELNHKKLSEGLVGIHYTFASVGSSQDNFLKLIDKINLKLGDKIEILEIIDFDKSLKVLINKEEEKNLSSLVADNIMVAV